MKKLSVLFAILFPVIIQAQDFEPENGAYRIIGSCHRIANLSASVQVDSTVYRYNQNNAISEMENYLFADRFATNMTSNTKETYTYSIGNNYVDKTTIIQNRVNIYQPWDFFQKIEERYTNGLLEWKNIAHYDTNSNSFINYHRFLRTYNENAQILEEYEGYWNHTENIWDMYKSKTNYYNEQGLIDSSIFWGDNSLPIFAKKNKYNTNGQLIKEEEFWVYDGSIFESLRSTTYNYANGKLIKMKRSQESGDTNRFEEQTYNYYLNKISKIVLTEYRNFQYPEPILKVLSKSTNLFYYDTDRNPYKSYSDYKNSTMPVAHVINTSYSFNDGNYMVKKQEKDHNDVLTNTYNYYYEDKPNVSTKDTQSQSKWSIFPNPTVDYLHLNTSFTEAVFHIFSLDGKLVKTGLIQNENTVIPVIELAQGAYILQIGNGTNTRSAKFIKQ